MKRVKGQMLVEALLAMGIITFSALGVVSLASRSIGESRSVADEFVAVNLASEGIEVSKNILDGNILNGRPWNEGFAPGSYEVDYLSAGLVPLSGNPRSLNFNGTTGLYSYSNLGQATSFKRTITIQNVNSDQIGIKTKVDWLSRGNSSPRSVNLESDLLNWRR